MNETNASQSTAYSRANSAYNLADSAYDRADDAYYYADDAYDLAWDNRLTDLNVFNVLTSGGTRFGIFSDSTSNRLYINANYIKMEPLTQNLLHWVPTMEDSVVLVALTE